MDDPGTLFAAGPFGWLVEGGVFKPFYSVNPTADAAEVNAALVRFLSSGVPELNRPMDPDRAGQSGPLRRKDFWAIVLAERAGTRLRIARHDSEAARDRKVDALLDSLKAPR